MQWRRVEWLAVETEELRGIRAQCELITSYALSISGKCEVPFNGDIRLLRLAERTVNSNPYAVTIKVNSAKIFNWTHWCVCVHYEPSRVLSLQTENYMGKLTDTRQKRTAYVIVAYITISWPLYLKACLHCARYNSIFIFMQLKRWENRCSTFFEETARLWGAFVFGWNGDLLSVPPSRIFNLLS
jgi:hypothetical protein